jgi:hypothetical protein
MNLASAMAVAVAERVERTGGPRAGLVAWKTLAGGATDADVRGRALLAALRCAVTLRDREAISELSGRWATVDSGVWDASIAACCNEMARTGLFAEATGLARAEARRHRTARSLYLHARCLELDRLSSSRSEVPGDAALAEAFRDAAARAGNEGAKDIEAASRVRRLAILGRSWLTMGEAFEEARQIDLPTAPPGSRLIVASVLLLSPSRFVRAGAIAALDAIVVAADERLARRALALLARWVDDVGDALTPLEMDRLFALFGRERTVALAPQAARVIHAIDRIRKAGGDATFDAALDAAAMAAPELAKSLARTRDVLRGRFEAAREPDAPPSGDEAELRRAFRHGQILDVVVALRDGAWARAARSLEALHDAEARGGELVPRQVLDVAVLALAHDDPDLRNAAVRVIALRLSRPGAGVPRGGFLALASTLTSLGLAEHARTALGAATALREPGAAEVLGTSLARAGWELAGAGARAEAIEKLLQAKAILSAPR